MRVSFFSATLLAYGASLPSLLAKENDEDPLQAFGELFTSPEIQEAMTEKLSLLQETMAEMPLWLEIHRKLQGPPSPRECGQEFTRATVDDIRAMVRFFLTIILPEELIETALAALTGVVKYEISASVVCLSCADIFKADLGEDAFTNDSPYGFPSYCSPDSYGYEATHSALVLAPIDPETGEIFTGKLRGFASGRSTEVSNLDTATTRFPQNISALLANENVSIPDKIVVLRNFLASGIAAAGGAVSVMPDFLGYGESREFDRPFLAPLPYKQAFGVSFLAAQNYIKSVSEGCTMLDNVATVTGYSEGGYAAVLGALALEQNGVRILSAHPGGSPFNLDVETGFVIKETAEKAPNVPFSFQIIVPFIGFGYSNGFPFLANTNTDQSFLAEEWMDPSNSTQNVIAWFAAPDALTVEQIFVLAPPDVSVIGNPDLLAIYEAARADGVLAACSDPAYLNDKVDKLCQALRESSLWDAIHNDITFPTSVCHSPEDDFVTYQNIPLFDENPNVVEFVSSIPGLDIQGDHQVAQILCPLDPITTVAFAQGDDTPTKMVPMDDPPPQCVDSSTPPAPPPTEAPSDPTGAPTNGSARMGLVVPTMAAVIVGLIAVFA